MANPDRTLPGRPSHQQRLEAVRQVAAGGDKVAIAKALRVQVNTLDQWRVRHAAEAGVAEEEDAPPPARRASAPVLHLELPEAEVDPRPLGPMERLEWEVECAVSDIAQAQADRSHIAVGQGRNRG